MVAEPFRQWVIEDRFTAGRPDWHAAGAQFVGNVAPFERLKLRLLNGSHSTLAYLGFLAGFETIAETMTHSAFVRFIQRLMDEEIAPTVPAPPGIDLKAYARVLMARFADPGVRHRTWQIAMDGSQKLPQRLLGTVRDRLAAGAPIDRLALGVAAWIRYVSGVDDQGRPIDVRDPLADRLAACAAGAGRDPRALTAALLGVSEVFGDDLPHAAPFAAAVTSALGRLLAEGARNTVEAWDDR